MIITWNEETAALFHIHTQSKSPKHSEFLSMKKKPRKKLHFIQKKARNLDLMKTTPPNGIVDEKWILRDQKIERQEKRKKKIEPFHLFLPSIIYFP